MATMKRKARRFEEGGSTGETDALEAANNSAESQAIADQMRGEEILKRMRDQETDEKPMPKAAPAVKNVGRANLSPEAFDQMKKTASNSSSRNPNFSNEGRTRPAPAKPSNLDYSNEGRSRPAPKIEPAAKKETYRDFSGKTREKSSGSDRPDFGSAIGRGISDFFGSIRERGRKSNPDAYAKGGSVTASKRADGIAQRGKTRGKIC